MKRIAPATLAPPEAMPEAGRRDKLASTMTIRLVALAEYVDDSCQRKEKNDKYLQSSWIPKLVGWLKLFVSRPAFAESPAGREEFVLCLKFLK